LSKKL